MTNVTHTVTCLHIRSSADAYIVGYLVSDEGDRVIIAQSISEAGSTTYRQVAIRKTSIIQRYDLPVVWW